MCADTFVCLVEAKREELEWQKTVQESQGGKMLEEGNFERERKRERQ